MPRIDKVAEVLEVHPAHLLQHLRCLRTLRGFPDIAHAARRLHCSQKALLQEIAAVRQQFGGEAIQLTMGRVTLHPELSRLLDD